MDEHYNTKSFVMERRIFDPMSLCTYGKVYDCGAKSFIAKALCRAFFSDIIQIHTDDRIIRYFKWFYPGKPVIMHYHGSCIRNRWKEKRKFYEKADMIFVSTPDLLQGAPSGVILVSNPLNWKHIKLVNSMNIPKVSGTAFHVEYGALDYAEKYAEDYNLKLGIFDRRKNPLNHLDFLKKLAAYEYYIDCKRDTIVHNHLQFDSLTALEAYALGLKVVRYNGLLMSELPDFCYPEKGLESLPNIYFKLLVGAQNYLSEELGEDITTYSY